MQSFIQNSRRGGFSRYPWLPEEDLALVNLVTLQGAKNWNKIAEHIPNRTGNSCRLRWLSQLSPEFDKSPFSDEEDRKLMTLYRAFGSKWSFIANFLPGRSSIQVRYHCHSLIKRNYSAAMKQRNVIKKSLAYLSSHRPSSVVPPVGSQVFTVFAPKAVRAGIHWRGVGLERASYENSIMREDCAGDQFHEGVTFIDFMGVGKLN